METQVYDVVLNAFFELREFDSDALNQPRILGRLGYRGGDGGRGDMRGGSVANFAADGVPV